MNESTLFYHKSVLVNEVLQYLNPKPGKVYIDATFGSGGHTRALLEKEPNCTVIALDWDMTVLERYGHPLQLEFPGRLRLIWGNFALLYRLLRREKIGMVDGILADFGTSQIQITERPGFSIYRDTPLDMRMSPPHQKLTAQELINKASEEKLREIFWEFGEERYAKQIAYAIVQDRQRKRFTTTGELADLIERVVPKQEKQKIHPATRVFQALRIYVNKELENITAFLSEAIRSINEGGSLVCISFHSLEDRLVKQFFREREQLGILKTLTQKSIEATDSEVLENPSARSAKLRAVQILATQSSVS